ncbi:alpha/beta fold hydrolase [Embleya sp. AB8]|uniref:alpha/beta fold hydrolase n=1 Tax=Embleya sp. AB8 TaxID=3156304 RepID=UPI003C765B13
MTAAADLLSMVDGYDAERFDVVALSLGARLTRELVEQAGGRVGRVVLGGMSPSEPFAAVDVPALRRAVRGEEAASDPLTGLIAGLIGAEEARAEGLVTCVEGLRGTPFAPGKWAGAAPPLFVVGADDPMTRGADELVAPAEGARLVTVPGDHHGALAGDRFRALAVEFVGR